MLAENDSMTTSQGLGDSGNGSTAPPSDPELDDLEREFRKLSKKERKRFNLRRPVPLDVGPLDPDPPSSIPDDATGLEAALSPDASAKGEDLDEGKADIQIPDSDTPQMSKRDKRRAREAAKKAAQGDNPPEEVSCLMNRERSWLIKGDYDRSAEYAVKPSPRGPSCSRISKRLAMHLLQATWQLTRIQRARGERRENGSERPHCICCQLLFCCCKIRCCVCHAR